MTEAKKPATYTAEQTRALVQAYKAGTELAELAEQFGRTEASIRAKLVREGAWVSKKATAYTEAQAEELAEAYAEGESVESLAERFGRPLASIRAVLVKAGGYKAQAGAAWSPEQSAELAELYQGGMRADDLATHFGRKKASIVAKLTSMKIYVKPTYTRKDGSEVKKKGDLASAVGAILRLGENDVTSLEKCTRNALAAIFAALANSKPI